ncbi:hypothetical protein BH09ACT13_BH09ACT13_05820 [soil metagenome]
MALKTTVLEDAERAELSEQDADEFFTQLNAFRDTLADKEKVVLATMVVEAIDGTDAPTGDGPTTMEPPTAEETDAFAEKLDKFHDSLPGDQHLFLDAILGKSWFAHEAEVEGYHWRLLDTRIIKNWQWQGYKEACGAVGGDRADWTKWRGSPRRRVACWDNTDY